MRIWIALLLSSALGVALAPVPAHAAVPVGIVVNPFNGDRAGPEMDGDAQAMLDGGLAAVIEAAGGRVASIQTVALTAEDERQYGRWNRFGLASGHLAGHAAQHAAAGLINLGLYNNCSSLLGMLGGLRHATATPRRVGLVWIDAHGDYNTPETTLSGMLGGMPVAIAAGDALQRMREQARLDQPIAKADIVMVGVRDTDPLEQQRIDADGIAQLSVADVRSLGEGFHAALAELTARTDVVYVHVDLDVLDPSVIPGHPLTVPDGPTGAELGAAIEAMFRYPKTEALGLASYPHQDDPAGVTMAAIRQLVAGAVRGAANRGGRP
ncbi:MAG: arginase family protein [Pseudomonadales bacterium]